MDLVFASTEQGTERENTGQRTSSQGESTRGYMLHIVTSIWPSSSIVRRQSAAPVPSKAANLFSFLFNTFLVITSK